MAKTEGTQSIPSALLDSYRATLGEQRPNTGVQKRYPWRLPTMQGGKANETAKQRTQRERFIEAKNNFAAVPWAERQRWYAARPPWSSFLWYYNYFIMSDLMGNADIKDGGAGVIKSIQFKQISMPAGAGEGSVAITAVDIAKTVVMLYGNSAIVLTWETGSVVVPVYPYQSSLAAELIKCKWSVTAYEGESTLAAVIGITVIEYI